MIALNSEHSNVLYSLTLVSQGNAYVRFPRFGKSDLMKDF